MVCGNCGKQLKDGVKFCDGCGASVESAAYTPVQSGAEEGAVLTGKRRGTGLVIGAAVGGVALVAAVIVLVVSLIGGPKATVGKAIAKSAAEFSEIADTFGVSTLTSLMEKQAVTQTLELVLESVGGDFEYYYGSSVKGLGIRVDLATDIPGRKMGAAATAKLGSAELVSGYVDINNNMVTVFTPEFMDDVALSINTETLGENLEEVGLTEYNEELEELSFNIFDVLQSDDKKEVEPMDPAAAKELLEAIEVEKDGKEEKEVNGEDVKCTLYNVVIPEDALADYMDALKDYVKDQDMDKQIADMMESMGADDYDIDDVKSEMNDAIDEAFEGVEMAIGELGDIELEVYISGGRVMAIDWTIKVDGTKVEVSLQLGGGKNYVDDLSLTMEGGGTSIVFESTGDHAASKGVFTDTTTFTVDDSWDVYELELETEYDTKAKEDNLTVDFVCEDVELNLEGTLTVGGSSVSLLVDDLTVKEYGSKLISLSGEYTVKAFEKVKIGAAETLKLSEMDEDDLQDLVEDIEDNASDWAYDFYEDNYELYNFLDNFFYYYF